MKQQRVRVNIRQLEDRLAVSKQTIWRWYTAGTFPQPHYLGKSRLWWLDDIEDWEMKHTRKTPLVPVAGRTVIRGAT